MHSKSLSLVFAVVVSFLTGFNLPACADEVAELKALDKTYSSTIRPLLKSYCEKCHSEQLPEADISLESFATLADVRKEPQTWIKVREMLESRQMPPEASKQPTDAERTLLRSWVRDYLLVEARAHAGDPGKVVIRRLSNAEYTYTIRDLTSVTSLDPAREFPKDGAAGEGFTNAGNALVMSPALITKYLDAAKDIAGHAVLLPDSIRFSPSTSRRDWTEEILTKIRALYREYTDPTGGTRVNLQGIVSETNTGGRIPLERYLSATLMERERLAKGMATIEQIATEHGLNAKYLGLLWRSLQGTEPSLVLNGIRARWRVAQPEHARDLAAEITAWQNELWKFATVGHIGKVGGPKGWMETVSPLIARQEIRYKIPAVAEAGEVTLVLVVSDAGDGNDHDFAIWENPRLVAPGRPDLLLRNVRSVTRELAVRRASLFARTAACLAAADEAAAAKEGADIAGLAEKHQLDQATLRSWLDYLGIGGGGPIKIEGHFTAKIGKASGYEFINGWGKDETPLLVANSSDQHVRIPGNMKPHGVAVHPSPTLRAVVGWKSPVPSAMRIEGKVQHAHPECGNGVTWSLELRRGAVRQRLATGIAQGSNAVSVGPLENISVHTGDLVSLLIGPRDGNHSCDLTAVDLKLTETGDKGRVWDLAGDVSGSIHAGNPHADQFGTADVWHFYVEPESGSGTFAPVIPPGSVLSRWQAAADAGDRQKLAADVQKLLTGEPPAAKDSPDAQLYKQLSSFGGPLLGLGRAGGDGGKNSSSAVSVEGGKSGGPEFGPDPHLFGKHPDGTAIDSNSLCVRAPAVVEFTLPADLVAGSEFVAGGYLDSRTGAEGSVQLQVLPSRPAHDSGLLRSNTTVTVANGQWSADNRRTSFGNPIIVNEKSAARKRIEQSFGEFRDLFPAALCYTKIVPIDEVVTLTQYYREDHHLMRLMLDDTRKSELDRLWDELHYVSQDAITAVDALAQLIQYATQDADPKVFEPLQKPFAERAAAFRRQLVSDEPRQLAAALQFADQAYRRPLSSEEGRELRELYAQLRSEELPHDMALRLVLARVLVSPSCVFRLEKKGVG
jgi:hypothetical protein